MHLHERCDALGLDSISAGTAAGFAVDLYERGIVGDARHRRARAALG